MWGKGRILISFLTFLNLLLFSIIFSNLIKGLYNNGIFKIIDQTKMEIFISLKSFFLIFFIMASYFGTIILYFEIEKIYLELNKRKNVGLKSFRIKVKIISN